MPRIPPLVAAGLIAFVAGAPGCSGKDPAPSSADLVGDLGILAEQQQFTRAQIRCVALGAERTLDDDGLSRFGDELDELHRTGSMAALSQLSRKTLTEAVADCAIEGDGG